uniref:Uncharacterized protein n=1 Tax=Eubacterium plexicaudatum ASF492 TaxID=1235802 RepID=N2ACZ0_9FIRM
MGFFKRRKDRAALEKVMEDVRVPGGLEQLSGTSSGMVAERCEQLMQNAREIDDGKKEYYIVTSYLNDIEIIENLAPDQAEEIQKAADYVAKLNQSRDQFLNTSKRISDAQFKMLQSQEDQIPDAIKNLRANEEYQATVKRDMQYLEGEKQEWEIQNRENRRLRKRLRRASFMLLFAAATAAVLMLVLSLGFDYDLQYAWIGIIAAALFGSAYIVFRLESSRRDIQQAEVNINYAILLLNKVKIKYVNITNAVDYGRNRFHVRDSREFEYQWEMYQNAMREQEKYRKTNEDLNYYYDKLVRLLKKCGLYDSRVWTEQPQALVDQKEMVEIKHDLLVRRQKLRSKIAFNLDIVKKERAEIIKALRVNEEARTVQVLEMIRSIDKLSGMEEKA